MSRRVWLALALLGAMALGALAAIVVDRLYWEAQLRAQLAEKEQTLAALNGDIVSLNAGLQALKTTNTELRTRVETALTETATVARSNQSSLEKLRSVIVRLEALRKSLAATP